MGGGGGDGGALCLSEQLLYLAHVQEQIQEWCLQEFNPSCKICNRSTVLSDLIELEVLLFFEL